MSNPNTTYDADIVIATKRDSSGYSGPSAGQQAEFDRIRKLGAKAFIDFIHSHPRSRLATRQEA